MTNDKYVLFWTSKRDLHVDHHIRSRTANILAPMYCLREHAFLRQREGATCDLGIETGTVIQGLTLHILKYVLNDVRRLLNSTHFIPTFLLSLLH